jgi:large subunit ribosomal protein L4
LELPVYNLAGEVVGQAELADSVFGVAMNEGLVHQAVVRYQANQRVGTANTLRRGEVAGGGKKPWKQKGTGRARIGSTRAPHWRGGGVVFGPHPREYRQELPGKMRRLALRCALSARAREEGIRLIEGFGFETPQTKQAAALIGAFGGEGHTLFVTPELDRNVYLSARNLPTASTTYVGQLNIYEVVRHQTLIMPIDAARRLEQKLAPAAKSKESPDEA